MQKYIITFLNNEGIYATREYDKLQYAIYDLNTMLEEFVSLVTYSLPPQTN